MPLVLLLGGHISVAGFLLLPVLIIEMDVSCSLGIETKILLERNNYLSENGTKYYLLKMK
jgi:hypothetical protein